VQRSAHTEMSLPADEIMQFKFPDMVTVMPGMPFNVFGVLQLVDKDDILEVDQHYEVNFMHQNRFLSITFLLPGY
jgi:hypothetical protein